MARVQDDVADILQQVRNRKPLVHCITNMVTANDCANILLAAGASPTMASHPMEVEEITANCNSLVCNFGAIKDYEAMLLAAKKASSCAHPIIIDPVGAGGSTYRRMMICDLMQQTKVSCIRGNASEIEALLYNSSTVTGVDAASNAWDQRNKEEFLSSLMNYCKEHQLIVVVSGEKDLVADGKQCYEISNGHPMMARITGSGCMSSAMLGAFLGVFAYNHTELLPVAVSAVVTMGVCGQIAAEACLKNHAGTMTFRMLLIDAMSCLTKEQIIERIECRRLI